MNYLRIFSVFLLVCSLHGCGSKAPPVTVCILKYSDELIEGRCTDPDGNQFVLQGQELDKYACIPFDDLLDLQAYCNEK